jgi:hypothetical protein
MCDKNWTAMKADVAMKVPEEIESLRKGYEMGIEAYDDPIDHGITALSDLHAKLYPVEAQEAIRALTAPSAEEKQEQQIETPPSHVPAPAVENPPMPVSSQTQTVPKQQSIIPPVKTVPTSNPVAKIKKKLSADVEKILGEAGADLREKLLKSNDKGDPVDAAE